MYEQLYVIHEVEGRKLIRADLSDDVLDRLSDAATEKNKTVIQVAVEFLDEMIADHLDEWMFA